MVTDTLTGGIVNAELIDSNRDPTAYDTVIDDPVPDVGDEILYSSRSSNCSKRINAGFVNTARASDKANHSFI